MKLLRALYDAAYVLVGALKALALWLVVGAAATLLMVFVVGRLA